MMTQCPVCGSNEIIPDLIVYSQGGQMGEHPIYVRLVEQEPPNLPFIWKPQSESAGFCAAICGDCGHIELYVNRAKELAAAYRQGFKSQRPV